jgi:hypothetical protein
MTHLSPEQLLDVADGTRPDDEFPHLQSCATCAREVAGLRGTIDAAAEVDIPEPSPLFWTHLSQRVRDAVAGEEPGSTDPKRVGLQAVPQAFARGWWRLAKATAVAAVVAAVFLSQRQQVLSPTTGVSTSVPGDVRQPVEVPAFDDDAALSLLADLTAGMDWEATAEAGLVPAVGAVDSVVLALSVEERVELHRLLQEALGGSGA